MEIAIPITRDLVFVRLSFIARLSIKAFNY